MHLLLKPGFETDGGRRDDFIEYAQQHKFLKTKSSSFPDSTKISSFSTVFFLGANQHMTVFLVLTSSAGL